MASPSSLFTFVCWCLCGMYWIYLYGSSPFVFYTVHCFSYFVLGQWLSYLLGCGQANWSEYLWLSQWFRAQFGPILVYTKCQMFSYKMVFMLNLMLLLENYSPMMYFVRLKQQFCIPLSMLYFARPVWNHTTQWGSKLLTEGTFFWVGLHEK